MTTSELAPVARLTGAALAEQVVVRGDLSKLTEQERMQYYTAVCVSLSLNPLTRPFEFITLNGKLTLYATRGAGDQLRKINGITITGLTPSQVGELFVVVATGRDRNGREDSSTGAVSTKGLSGEALANAMMKAETKAKRRLTLSLAGLGLLDESEVASIPTAVRSDVDPDTGEIRKPPTLAEKVAAKAAAIEAVERTEAAPVVRVLPSEYVNPEEIAEGAPAILRTGLTAQVLAKLARDAGKTKGQLAMAIGAIGHEVPAPQDVSDVVTAMTDEDRGRLATELNLDVTA